VAQRARWAIAHAHARRRALRRARRGPGRAGAPAVVVVAHPTDAGLCAVLDVRACVSGHRPGGFSVPWNLRDSRPARTARAPRCADELALSSGRPGNGRMLLSAYALGLLLTGSSLLRVARVDRFHLIWLFPLVFSRLVSWGFFGFVTAIPLIFGAIVLSFRWLESRTWRHGSALAVALVLLVFWHGLAIATAAYFFLVLWLLWRTPSWRARGIALWPLAPAGLLFLRAGGAHAGHRPIEPVSRGSAAAGARLGQPARVLCAAVQGALGRGRQLSVHLVCSGVQRPGRVLAGPCAGSCTARWSPPSR
jgi:hypothetical protein